MRGAALAIIGHNNPPGAIPIAAGVIHALGEWMKDHPVISNEAEAREAKVFKDCVESALREIEQERDAKVRPLNEAVTEINAVYHAVHNLNARKPGTFDTLLAELKIRLTAFVRAEEQRRREAAEAARRAAEEAERQAREAEAREREAAIEASQGICDIDIVDAAQSADTAFANFQRATHVAQRADRDTKVRIGGGFGRIASLRNHEVLTVTDWRAAIEEMGLTDTLREAILTSARAYRKAAGELPEGIQQSFERSM